MSNMARGFSVRNPTRIGALLARFVSVGAVWVFLLSASASALSSTRRRGCTVGKLCSCLSSRRRRAPKEDEEAEVLDFRKPSRPRPGFLGEDPPVFSLPKREDPEAAPAQPTTTTTTNAAVITADRGIMDRFVQDDLAMTRRSPAPKPPLQRTTSLPQTRLHVCAWGDCSCRGGAAEEGARCGGNVNRDGTVTRSSGSRQLLVDAGAHNWGVAGADAHNWGGCDKLCGCGPGRSSQSKRQGEPAVSEQQP